MQHMYLHIKIGCGLSRSVLRSQRNAYGHYQNLGVTLDCLPLFRAFVHDHGQKMPVQLLAFTDPIISSEQPV